MGIYSIATFLRRECKETKDAWVNDTYPPASPDTVVVEDLLTRMHQIKGPRGNSVMSVLDLVRYIVGPACRMLRDGVCKTYVLIIDDQRITKHMRKLRHLEIVKPDRNKPKVEPYPVSCDLSFAGVHSGPVPNPCNIPDEKATPHEIDPFVDTERLMHTEGRHMRRKLWDLVATYVMSHAFVIPSDCTFLLDHTYAGPTVVVGSTKTLCDHDRAHFFAEADLAMLYWTGFYSRHPIWIISTDTDTLATCSYFVETTRPPQPIYWISNRSQDPVRYCHMQSFVTAVRHKAGWRHLIHLMIAVLISGTDYVAKSWFCDRISEANVYRILNQLSKDKSRELSTALASAKNFYVLIEKLYQMSGTVGRQVKCPYKLDKEFKEHYTTLIHNYKYWFRKWYLMFHQGNTSLPTGDRPQLNFIHDTNAKQCNCTSKFIERPETHDLTCPVNQSFQRSISQRFEVAQVLLAERCERGKLLSRHTGPPCGLC